MRIGIFSDVHSNLEALVAVLKRAEELKVDRLISLGDVVGYGASPEECCRLVRSNTELTLLGNHDAAVVGRMDYSYYYGAARHVLDWTAGVLSEDSFRWLSGLPYTYRYGENVLCSHGAPFEPQAYEYVFSSDQIAQLLPEVLALPRLSFVGHSHLCKVFRVLDGEVVERHEVAFELEPAAHYLISVGSVGQPRDYDNRACFVVLDEGAQSMEFVRVEYDIATSAQKILDASLATSFANRLVMGI
ncbi:MAG: metallophosphatase family protein [Proteobacteria bacterium]|nr:metallophosphatase family protein [Cystobacterineae bacterium]MCL2258645.1 metallophosphatase family protein [Cystobacterineae bacterium]MCL2314940.1 metallophosphatase family protein [Pseudomonadota bacterium]